MTGTKRKINIQHNNHKNVNAITHIESVENVTARTHEQRTTIDSAGQQHTIETRDIFGKITQTGSLWTDCAVTSNNKE